MLKQETRFRFPDMSEHMDLESVELAFYVSRLDIQHHKRQFKHSMISVCEAGCSLTRIILTPNFFVIFSVQLSSGVT